jgi:hypothetical protein
MPVHTVEQGECLSSLAARYGFRNWEDIYSHPANGDLRKKRPNPNVLAPGDKVVVPEPTLKSVAVATGKTHVFKVRLAEVKLRVVLVDRKGKPCKVKRFTVNAGAREIKGTSAPNGMVEADISAAETTARLRVWLDGGQDDLPTIDRNLSLGHIDPIDKNSGIQGRLSNLGYKCPLADESEGDDVPAGLLAAARAFRADYGLPEVEQPGGDGDAEAQKTYADKVLDGALRSKLVTVYESSAAS